MLYAVVRESFDLPTFEQMDRAFKQVPFYTTHDAHHKIQNACGLIAENLAYEKAKALFGALASVGVHVSLIEQSLLVPLAGDYRVKRVTCSQAGFEPYDVLGRKMPVQWADVLLLASGVVPFYEHRLESKMVAKASYIGTAYGGVGVRFVQESQYIESKEQGLRIEVFLAVEPWRISIKCHQFIYEDATGEHGYQRDLARDASELICDMVGFAPHVWLGPGAKKMRDGDHQLVEYNTKNVYEKELIWLMWYFSRQA